MTLVRVVKNSDDSNKKLNYEEETLHEHKKKSIRASRSECSVFNLGGEIMLESCAERNFTPRTKG